MEKLYQKLNLISKWYYSYQTWGIWVRHKWHECGTSATQVRLSDTSATRVRISARRTTRVRHERKINYTSENIFSHPCINYMANERLQREEQFHSKNYLLESLWKVWTLLWQSYIKSYSLDYSCKCPCKFLQSYV